MLAVDALQNAILRLYGSQAGGQVIAGRLISFSLDSISGILEGGTGNQELEDSLSQSNWVIINMLDAEPGQPRPHFCAVSFPNGRICCVINTWLFLPSMLLIFWMPPIYPR